MRNFVVLSNTMVAEWYFENREPKYFSEMANTGRCCIQKGGGGVSVRKHREGRPYIEWFRTSGDRKDKVAVLCPSVSSEGVQAAGASREGM